LTLASQIWEEELSWEGGQSGDCIIIGTSQETCAIGVRRKKYGFDFAQPDKTNCHLCETSALTAVESKLTLIKKSTPKWSAFKIILS